MSKARDLADLAKNANDRLDTVATSDGALSNRNMVINGGFNVWQRGDSQTANGYGSADRWFCNLSGATGTYSKVSNTGDMNTVGMVSPHSMSIVTTGADNNTGMWTYVEDVYKTSGKTVTLSFWGYNAGSSKNYKYSFIQKHPSVSNVALTNTFVLQSGWNHYSFTVDLAYIGDHGYSNASSTQVEITCTDNTTLDVKFTDIQLEVGDTATPFEHRSYGDELAKCQRYYIDFPGPMNIHGFRYNSSVSIAEVQFPTTMRTAPTVNAVNGAGTTSDTVTHVTGFMRAYNDTDNNFIDTYTADAEL